MPCFIHPTSLQARLAQIPSLLHWDDPSLSIPLLLEEDQSDAKHNSKSGEQSSPPFQESFDVMKKIGDYILRHFSLLPMRPSIKTSKPQSSELLTFLTLYRAIRLIYGGLCCDHTRDLIPGWETELVVALRTPPTYVRNDPEGNGHLVLKTRKVVNSTHHEDTEAPLLRNFLRLKNFWDKMDAATRSAVRHFYNDLRSVLSDPRETYRALADLFMAFSSSQPLDPRLIGPLLVKMWNRKPSASKLNSGDDSNTTALPFLYISKYRQDPCRFSVGVRGSRAFADWILDFHGWTSPWTPFDSYAHTGTQLISNSLLPITHDYLQRQTKCDLSNTHLTFYGHSLGATVAQHMAIHTATRFPSIKINAVLFSPFKHLPKSLEQQGHNLVNTRVVMDVSDPLAHAPCRGLPRCGRGHFSPPGEGKDRFADATNVVWLQVKFEKDEGEDLTNSTLLDLLYHTLVPHDIRETAPSINHILAAHSCSHSCALSQACNNSRDTSFEWWCRDCPGL